MTRTPRSARAVAVAACRRVVARAGGEHREAGAVAAFVVAIAVALFAVGGLVVDGGRAINARQRVADHAEQAARAGADRIDPVSLRQGGTVRIDPVAGASAARSYLASLPGSPYTAAEVTVQASATEVTVRTEETVKTTILSIVGIGSFTVDGAATSRPAAGITSEF